jgi:hypothetical protein
MSAVWAGMQKNIDLAYAKNVSLSNRPESSQKSAVKNKQSEEMSTDQGGK